jgi:glycosyltransferase involved in cell wall biosynthesis
MKFSIIVPAYNVEKYIPECLQSVERQTFKDYELVLVNDGSTDATGRLCDAYRDGHPSTKVIHQENGWLSSARNAGLAVAEGDYILFLDADDFLEQDCLRLLSSKMDGFPDRDIYINDYYDYYSKEQIVAVKAVLDPEIMESGDAYVTLAGLFKGNGNYIVFSWRSVYKREVILESSLSFDEDIRACEDFDFFMNFILHANKVCFTGVFTHYYRRSREGSITASASPVVLINNLQVFSRWYDALAVHKNSSGADFLLHDIATKFLFFVILSASLPPDDRNVVVSFATEREDILFDGKGMYALGGRIVIKMFGLKRGTSLLFRLFGLFKKQIRRSIKKEA